MIIGGSKLHGIKIISREDDERGTVVNVYIDEKPITGNVTSLKYEQRAGSLAQLTIELIAKDVTLITDQMKEVPTDTSTQLKFCRDWTKPKPPKRRWKLFRIKR